MYKLLRVSFFLIWLTNGVFCKILKMVPRHQEIVGRILGGKHAGTLTILIGFAELGMAIWILSGRKRKLNTIIQMAIILTMNAIEYSLAPDLLLWGKGNSFFAIILVLLIWYNEFYLFPGPTLKEKNA